MKRESWKGKNVTVKRKNGRFVSWYETKARTKVETWKRYGKVEVTRDKKGKLVTWHKLEMWWKTTLRYEKQKDSAYSSWDISLVKVTKENTDFDSVASQEKYCFEYLSRGFGAAVKSAKHEFKSRDWVGDLPRSRFPPYMDMGLVLDSMGKSLETAIEEDNKGREEFLEIWR